MPPPDYKHSIPSITFCPPIVNNDPPSLPSSVKNNRPHLYHMKTTNTRKIPPTAPATAINIVLARFFLETLYGGTELTEKGRTQVELIIEKKRKKMEKETGHRIG